MSILFPKKCYCYKKGSEDKDAMKPLKEKVSITLDETIVKSIKELAEKDDRSFSQYINKVLKDHLSEKSERFGNKSEPNQQFGENE